jgi:hypothetical protein
MKRFLFAALATLAIVVPLALPQGQPVNQVLAPPPQNYIQLFFCGTGFTACANGNTNVTAICLAPAWNTVKTTYIVPTTLTNIVVSSNVGTITFVAAQPFLHQWITVAGSSTTALNGTYLIQTQNGVTPTITTSGVSNATYTDMTISTQQPTMDQAAWSIQLFFYTNASVNAILYAGNPVNPQVPQGLKCSSVASY